MRVAVTGATGTIGRRLVAELVQRGDEVTALSRDPERARQSLEGEAAAPGGSVETAGWPDPKAAPPPLDALRGRDGVVNLLGERLDQRWTEAAKREIADSRVLSTRNLVAALRDLPEAERPRVLVSQSASGWYGDRGAEPVDESAAQAGDDFEARLTGAWEAEARAAEELGVRVVVTRTGVVLARAGGALAKMLPFFRLGLGGPVAGGSQHLPWVHVDDVAGALAFCLDNDAAAGPINVVAPEPATNAQFSKALGRALKRPAALPVPAFALKLLYGEMATTVTTGANVRPARLEQLAYGFRHPKLDEALRAALSG